MKLLFDHNLPPLLVFRLANLFPDSQHVFTIGLDRASDSEIREQARQNGYAIVTKDADFSELCVLFGFPPKIIGSVAETVRQQRLNNCCFTTSTISKLWAKTRQTEC